MMIDLSLPKQSMPARHRAVTAAALLRRLGEGADRVRNYRDQAIRDMLTDGATQAEVAVAVGLSKQAISQRFS